MLSKMKVEVIDGDYVLEVYERVSGKLSISIRTEDPSSGLEVTVGSQEFLGFLYHLLRPKKALINT